MDKTEKLDLRIKILEIRAMANALILIGNAEAYGLEMNKIEEIEKKLIGTVVLCPKCKIIMENLGNITNEIYTSYPPQWDEVHVCHGCKVKIIKRERGPFDNKPDYSYLDYYTKIPETT